MVSALQKVSWFDQWKERIVGNNMENKVQEAKKLLWVFSMYLAESYTSSIIFPLYQLIKGRLQNL